MSDLVRGGRHCDLGIHPVAVVPEIVVRAAAVVVQLRRTQLVQQARTCGAPRGHPAPGNDSGRGPARAGSCRGTCRSPPRASRCRCCGSRAAGARPGTRSSLAAGLQRLIERIDPIVQIGEVARQVRPLHFEHRQPELGEDHGAEERLRFQLARPGHVHFLERPLRLVLDHVLAVHHDSRLVSVNVDVELHVGDVRLNQRPVPEQLPLILRLPALAAVQGAPFVETVRVVSDVAADDDHHETAAVPINPAVPLEPRRQSLQSTLQRRRRTAAPQAVREYRENRSSGGPVQSIPRCIPCVTTLPVHVRQRNRRSAPVEIQMVLPAEARERELHGEDQQRHEQAAVLVRHQHLDEHCEHRVQQHVQQPRHHVPPEVVPELEAGVAPEHLHGQRAGDADEVHREQHDGDGDDLGNTTNDQSAAGVASMNSCTRRSRSRHTSSPA